MNFDSLATLLASAGQLFQNYSKDEQINSPTKSTSNT